MLKKGNRNRIMARNSKVNVSSRFSIVTLQVCGLLCSLHVKQVTASSASPQPAYHGFTAAGSDVRPLPVQSGSDVRPLPVQSGSDVKALPVKSRIYVKPPIQSGSDIRPLSIGDIMRNQNGATPAGEERETERVGGTPPVRVDSLTEGGHAHTPRSPHGDNTTLKRTPTKDAVGRYTELSKSNKQDSSPLSLFKTPKAKDNTMRHEDSGSGLTLVHSILSEGESISSVSDAKDSSNVQRDNNFTAKSTMTPKSVGSNKERVSVMEHTPGLTGQATSDFRVVYLSASRAYLQSPGWGSGDNSPRSLDEWETVTLAPGTALTITPHHLSLHGNHGHSHPSSDTANNDCDTVTGDSLSVYYTLRDTTSTTLLWKLCGGSPMPLPAEVRDARAVDFHFVTSDVTTDSGAYASGFKLWLSFLDAAKQSVESSPVSSDSLQTHLSERNASSDTDVCSGEGLTPIGAGMCLRLHDVSSSPHYSWAMADALCKGHNSVLPSLNTPGKWQAMLDFLSDANRTGISATTYIGFRLDNSSFAGSGAVWLYEGLGRWSDGSVAFYTRAVRHRQGQPCSVFRQGKSTELLTVECDERGDRTTQVVCQVDTARLNNTGQVSRHGDTAVTRPFAPLPELTRRKEIAGRGLRLISCSQSGHYVHTYLACQQDCYGLRPAPESPGQQSQAWKAVFQDPHPSREQCNAPLSLLPPSFTCDSGLERVAFTLVCDHVTHCPDGSDENFCHYVQCQGDQFQCGDSWQCIGTRHQCDGHQHCTDGSDETPWACNRVHDGTLELPPLLSTLPPPVLIDTNRHGRLTLTSLTPDDVSPDGEEEFSCPADTHWRCSLYCMPVYLRCNGVQDCPGGEDERSCEDYDCAGLYLCQRAVSRPGHVKVCVALHHVCDGAPHCPLQDDEQLCGRACPLHCSCHGLAFTCTGSFLAHTFPGLRFLDASSSGMSLEDLRENKALVYLSLASNRVKAIPAVVNFPNLRTLDLSFNDMREFGGDVLKGMPNLRDLSLRSNPLVFPFSAPHRLALSSLRRLDLSMVWASEIGGRAVSRLGLTNLQVLNLSYTGVERVCGSGFQSLGSLRTLDLRGCPLTSFPPDSFTGLAGLQELHASNPKLCCPGVVPDTATVAVCSGGGPTMDVTSSCDTLLHSNYYRLLLIIFAALAIAGNAGSLVYRAFLHRQDSGHSCGVMVSHLCVSDLLMGGYLVVIGVADTLYGPSFLTESAAWRASWACKAAGFVSLLSSEVSAFLVCLLTVDRVLTLRGAHTGLGVRTSSAGLVCWLTWACGVFLASVPLIQTHWTFYGHSDTCLPLPTTPTPWDGREYSLGVLVVLNLALFLVVATGQALVYWYLHTGSKTLGARTPAQCADRAITRRVIAIALTDSLCWFPVCLLGVLASSGVAMPRHVDTALSIVVLPLNSAVNPFIYTVSMALGSRGARPLGLHQAEKTFLI